MLSAGRADGRQSVFVHLAELDSSYIDSGIAIACNIGKHTFETRGLLSSIAMRSQLFLLLVLGSLAAVGQAAMGQPLRQAPSADADEFFRAGIAAQQHGDNRTAIEDFRKALAIRPEMVQARTGLGAALAATGQFDAAIDEDSRALAMAPDKIAVRRNLGMAYYKKGDVAHAREQFETIHAALPTDLQAAVMLGYVYIKLDREAEAANLLTPLEAGHEGNTDLEYVLAFSLIQSGKEKEGVPRMERVAKATHSANAYVIAGSTHLHRGEMLAARIDLDAAMQLDPSIPGLATMAGQARYAMLDMKESALAFQAALRQNPRDFNANLDLGAIRLKERDLENARPLLELALELQPASPLARLEMAKLNETTGRYAEAAATLEDLVKAEPNWVDAHWELAAAYIELHRAEEGKRERMIAQQLRFAQQKAEPESKEP
jgi:tetratricopeptide (TPR) repeat protein